MKFFIILKKIIFIWRYVSMVWNHYLLLTTILNRYDGDFRVSRMVQSTGFKKQTPQDGTVYVWYLGSLDVRLLE